MCAMIARDVLCVRVKDVSVCVQKEGGVGCNRDR